MIFKNKKLKEVAWHYKPGINIQGISIILTIFLISILQRCKLSWQQDNDFVAKAENYP